MVLQSLIVVDDFFCNADDMRATAERQSYTNVADVANEKNGLHFDERHDGVALSPGNGSSGSVADFLQRYLAQKITHWSPKYFEARDGRRNVRNGSYLRVHANDTPLHLRIDWGWAALIILTTTAADDATLRLTTDTESTALPARYNRLIVFRTHQRLQLSCTSTFYAQLLCFDVYTRRMIDAPLYHRRLELIKQHHVHDVMSHEFCDQIVAAAEQWATEHGGWTTRRHSRYPTTDVPVKELPCNDAVREHLFATVFPLLAEHYLFDTKCMSLNDLFVVKYAPAADGGQAELGWHRDISFLSFNVSLSRADEFEGGGTHFQASGQVVRIDKGQAIMHSGQVYHAGAPVTKGTRYILVAFVPVQHDAIDHEFLRATVSAGACDADVFRGMFLC